MPAQNKSRTGPRTKRATWHPSPKTQALILSTWEPIDAVELENPLQVIERNMIFYSVLGNRTLEAAAKLRDSLPEDRSERSHKAGAPTIRDVTFLMEMGMDYRLRAEKSAIQALPYRIPKVTAVPPETEADADQGSAVDAFGADPRVIEDITRTLERVKGKTAA